MRIPRGDGGGGGGGEAFTLDLNSLTARELRVINRTIATSQQHYSTLGVNENRFNCNALGFHRARQICWLLRKGGITIYCRFVSGTTLLPRCFYQFRF